MKSRRLRKNQKGMMTIEATILMPMVCIILFSCMYACIYLYDVTSIKSTIRNEWSQGEEKAELLQKKIQQQTIRMKRIYVKYSEDKENIEIKGEGYRGTYHRKKKNSKDYIRKVKIIADGIEGK